VIVVIGSLRARGSGEDTDVAGLSAAIASAAAADGSLVEVIARLGDDPGGDAVSLALARRHVGHVAILRDPGRATAVVAHDAEDRDPAATDGNASRSAGDEGPRLEAADANLALRYLPEISVIVTVHIGDDVLAEAIDAASWAETSLVIVVPPGAAVPSGLPEGALTLEAEDGDESAAGAAIGRYAAALDHGETAREAYDTLVASVAT
jgi:hypothetical protein